MANSRITQISNLFNLIVQSDPEARSYLFGWPNDMNVDRQNNSDPTGSIGNQYPLVDFVPPVKDIRLEDSGTLNIYDNYRVKLFFCHVYGYKNGTMTYKTDTGILVMARLENIVGRFLKTMKEYANISETPFTFSDPRVTFDPDRFTQATRCLLVEFELVLPAACNDYVPDLSGFPASFEDIPTYDLEDPINTNPV